MIALIGQTEKYPLIEKFAQLHEESVQVFDQISKAEDLVDKFKVSSLYSHLIVDLSVLDNTEEELYTAFYTLNAMSHSILLLLVQGYDHDAPVIQRLREAGLQYFVFSWDEEQAARELEQGYRNEPPPAQIERESPDRSVCAPAGAQNPAVKIGVAGVCARIGTTTQAVRLCLHLLENPTAAVSYADHSGLGHVEMMRDIFTGTEDHREAGFMIYRGLPMYYAPPEQLPPGISVHDYGTDAAPLADCDKKILIAGSAPWEMVALSELLANLPHDDNTWYLFTFAGKEEQQDILEFMGKRWANTLFADFAPDLFAPLSQLEQDTYKKILNTRSVVK